MRRTIVGCLALLTSFAAAITFGQWWAKRSQNEKLANSDYLAAELAKAAPGFDCPNLSVSGTQIEYTIGERGGTWVVMPEACRTTLRQRLDDAANFQQGKAKYFDDNCYRSSDFIESQTEICFEEGKVYIGAQRYP